MLERMAAVKTSELLRTFILYLKFNDQLSSFKACCRKKRKTNESEVLGHSFGQSCRRQRSSLVSFFFYGTFECLLIIFVFVFSPMAVTGFRYI